MIQGKRGNYSSPTPRKSSFITRNKIENRNTKQLGLQFTKRLFRAFFIFLSVYINSLTFTFPFSLLPISLSSLLTFILSEIHDYPVNFSPAKSLIPAISHVVSFFSILHPSPSRFSHESRVVSFLFVLIP